MIQPNNSEWWVVYLMKMREMPTGMPAVIEQHEWEKLDSAVPGRHTLLRDRIASEAEADQLARNPSTLFIREQHLAGSTDESA
jgi:hypothetical protein